MYDTSCSSSPLPSSSRHPPFDSSDEISVYLHHLLHSSSSSSPSTHLIYKPPPPGSPPQPPSNLVFSSDHHQIRGGGQVNRVLDSDSRVRDGTSVSATESSSGFKFSSSGIFFPSEAPISSSLATVVGDCDAVTVSVKRQRRFPSENDLDDFDCESEEGFEGSDGPSKPVQPRGSSKRSRAAEVHNLSEKRRRSRINEKMKALQNLIPNSNKTDKASMLDEAIEYLKQLQLQVQMLSMRNGFSLHPMYLPGVVQPLQLPQVRLGFNEGNGLQHHVNIGRDTLPVNPEASAQTSFGLPNQCTTSNQGLVIPTMPNIGTLETSYGLDSSIQVNRESFQLPAASKEFYQEQMLARQKLYSGQSSRNQSENKLNAIAGASLPFDAQPSATEHSDSLEARGLHRERSLNILPKDVDNKQILVQHMHRQD